MTNYFDIRSIETIHHLRIYYINIIQTIFYVEKIQHVFQL